ncbi:MAG: hypothetical protein CSA32_01275 [Desulfobulbus propionicus]|nr:MAG: hypothetical protein CSA32_01275 [Desulfobulbus propionicus]
MKRVVSLALFLGVFLVNSAFSTEFSADMIIETMGMKQQGKLYCKSEDLFRTEIMGMISIVQRPKIYNFLKNSKKYVVTDERESAQKNPVSGVSNFQQWIEKNQVKKAGSEKIADYSCDIYEGDVQVSSDQPMVHVKVWYSPELRYGLRFEADTGGPVGTVAQELENIQVGNQKDELFTVPADYTETDSMLDAMGLGGLASEKSQEKQGGASSGEMKEELMKIMDNLMEQSGSN